jgi:uncharacterized protein
LIEILGTLVELQEIDNELRRYQLRRDELTGKLAELQSLVARMEESIGEKQTKLAEVEAWYREQADSVRMDSERISKLKGSLGSVTKTKEYLLRQREIETLRKAKQSKEEELKKAEEAIEDFRQTILEEEENLDILKKETADEGGEGWNRVKSLEAKMEEIAKGRVGLLPLIPSRFLRKYESVANRRDGLGVVSVADGSCGGCHVQIRPQLFNILLRRESLEICPMCSRFLYIPDDYVPEEEEAE